MDISEQLMEVWKRHMESSEKYVYFQLAAAASAIAFAVSKTEGSDVSWLLLPAAIAALSWLASFFCGCMQITWMNTALYANHGILELRAGIHEKQPRTEPELRIAVQTVNNVLEGHIRRSQRYFNWQFRFLILGGLSLLVWRVMELVS